MRYFCFGVTWLKMCFQGGRKLSMLNGLVADAFGKEEESGVLDMCLAIDDGGRPI